MEHSLTGFPLCKKNAAGMAAARSINPVIFVALFPARQTIKATAVAGLIAHAGPKAVTLAAWQ